MLAEKVRVSTMSVILTVLLKLSYPTFFVNRTSNQRDLRLFRVIPYSLTRHRNRLY